MRKLIKMFIGLTLVITFFTACSNVTNPSPSESEIETESTVVSDEIVSPSSENLANDVSEQVNITIYVEGYEWGPGVPKVIVNFNGNVNGINAENFTVSTNKKTRTVTEIYASDEKGNKVDTSGQYITFELATDSSNSGTPFYYSMVDMFNHWVAEYPVTINGTGFTLDNLDANLNITQNCINSLISPAAEAFNWRGEHTLSSTNPMTKTEESLTLQLAAYEPESLASGEKNPLIIWLHGQGEGGTSSEISLLGNEVVALAQDPIQSYFTSGNQTGAYVLVPTAPTYWMDEGNGMNGPGAGVSRYTWVLMDAIENYVSARPDIDPDRIYIGGCSNGGYMTMNMIVEFPEYFAAAYPICEAYSYYAFENGRFSQNRWFTQEKAELLKDLPIWFVHSNNDTVVSPNMYSVPKYYALLMAGAENAWFSMFETVVGSDDTTAMYMGHFAWVYLFNNKVTGVQDVNEIKASVDDPILGFTADNNGGGAHQAVYEGIAYSNIFEWLNAQHR